MNKLATSVLKMNPALSDKKLSAHDKKLSAHGKIVRATIKFCWLFVALSDLAKGVYAGERSLIGIRAQRHKQLD